MDEQRKVLASAGTSPEQKLRVGPIIRDVVIVWLLTYMGGFVIGLASNGESKASPRYILALAASNVLFGTVAFTIAGYLAPPRKWRHLFLVAFGAWVISLTNVLFFRATIAQWIGGALFIVLMMGLGGGLSHFFRRASR